VKQTKDERRTTNPIKKTAARFWFVLLCWAIVLVACQAPVTPTPTPHIDLAERLASTECLSEDPPIALVGGTLIDGTGAAPILGAALVIQGRCIAAVGPRGQVSLPADAQIIELDGASLLPGLIDAHVHNAYVARNLHTWAQAGVTTVRDLGAPLGFPYFAKQDQLAADPRNARVLSAGPLVTVPDGYPIVPNGFASLTVTSPEDARDKTSQLVDAGADVIKITFSSSLPTLSPEEAATIAQTAHERGIPVTAHATNPRELAWALDAGVDDVAHISGGRVQDRTLHRMVQEDVYWVPTLEAVRGEGSENLARFIKAGGQVALGTDAGYLAGLEIGLPIDEMTLMQETGMTPMQIILAATRNAAHVCRLEHELGTLKPGKLADVLVVDGNPLEDLQALNQVRLVIHGGVIIRGK